MPSHSRRHGYTEIDVEYRSARRGYTSFDFHSRRHGYTSLSAIFHSPRSSRTDLYPAAFASVYYSPDVDNWLGVGSELTQPEISMTLSGVDIRPYLKSLTLTRPFNGKMQLSCVFGPTFTNYIADTHSKLVPPGTGVFAGLIRQHDNAGTRYIALVITVGGAPWVAPLLLPLPASHDGTDLSWTFEGKTRYLEKSISAFDDIVWELGDRKTAHDAQIEMGNAIGVTILPRYPNYMIARLDRGRNNLLGPCDACAKPMQAGRREVGNAIEYRQAKIGTPKWYFIDRCNIKSLRKFERESPKNSYTLARIDPIGGSIGELKSTKMGFNTITFNIPSKQVSMEIRAFGCSLATFQYFDTSGNLLNVSPEAAYYTSSVNIGSARFIATPGSASQANPEFSIIARGTPRPDQGAYTATAQDTTLQGIYGANPEQTEVQDSIILDGSTLQLSANAYQNEQTLSGWGLEIESDQANPHIEPGDTISVTDKLTAQVGELWFVDLHVFQYNVGNDGEPATWQTSLTCRHGEAQE